MVKSIPVFVIMYGNWTATSPAVPIITDLLRTAGGSPYEGVNTTYYNTSNAISGQLTLGTVVYDSYSKGKILSDNDVWTVVTSHIGKDLPSANPDAVYFVITSGDVAESSGFGSGYCGWHNAATIGTTDVKFAFVGDPSLLYASGCGAQTTGPNGNSGADAMASVILHELNEAASDPDGNAWYFDKSGNENEDQCAWTFGTTYLTANGAKANMKLGARDFLIQRNWLNVGTGTCALTK